MAKIILLITTLTITYRYIETTVVGDDDVNIQKELATNNYIEIRNHTNYTNSSDEGLSLYSELVSHNDNDNSNNNNNNSYGYNIGLNETNSQINHHNLNGEITGINFNKNINNDSGSIKKNSKSENSSDFLLNRNENETNVLDSFSFSSVALSPSSSSPSSSPLLPSTSSKDVENSLNNSKVINDRTSKNISQYPLANEKEDHIKILLNTITTNISKQLEEGDHQIKNKKINYKKETEIIDEVNLKNNVKLVKGELSKSNEWKYEQPSNFFKSTVIKRAQHPLNKLNKTENDFNETRNLIRYNTSTSLLKNFNKSYNTSNVNITNVSTFFCKIFNLNVFIGSNFFLYFLLLLLLLYYIFTLS